MRLLVQLFLTLGQGSALKNELVNCGILLSSKGGKLLHTGFWSDELRCCFERRVEIHGLIYFECRRHYYSPYLQS